MELSPDLKKKLSRSGEGLIQIAEGLENHLVDYYRGTPEEEAFGEACNHIRILARTFDRWANEDGLQPPEFKTCVSWATELDRLSVAVARVFVNREEQYATGDPEALNNAASALRAFALAKAG